MIEQIMSHGLSEQAAREIIEQQNPLNEMEVVKRRAWRQKKIQETTPMIRGDKIECEIYSRPCGYFRPIKQFNPGKQAEFWDRVSYKIPEVI